MGEFLVSSKEGRPLKQIFQKKKSLLVGTLRKFQLIIVLTILQRNAEKS